MKVLLVLFGLSAAAHLEANPIRRIVNLLQAMQKEVAAEGVKEKELFDKFMCYCKGNNEGLKKDIQANIDQAKQLEADVDAKTARKAQLDQELAEHKKDRAEAKVAIEKASAIRQKEHAAYEKESGDQKEYISALDAAIPAIEKGMGRTGLLQIPRSVEALKRALEQATSVTQSEKDNVLSFLSTNSPYGDYASASGEIVGILKQMRDDIDKDLNGIVSAEDEAQKAFDDLISAKTSEIKANSEAIEKKSVRSGELAVEITQDKNARANALRESGSNTEFLANLQRDCATKEDEFNTRQKTRSEESLAISEAIKILNDDDALDIFKKTLPSPAQVGTSFLQRLEESKVTRRAKAFAFIQSAVQGSSDRTTQLGLIAYMLRAGKVDFSKVLKMIDDMVSHLGAEQKNDEDELAFCNQQFEESDDKRKDLNNSIQGLTSEIDESKADVDTLSQDIDSLKNKISELDASTAEATNQRKEEHAAFVTSLSELTAASQLVDKATNRLNQFYNPALYKPPPPRELTEEERIAQNLGEELPTQAPQLIAGTNIAVNFMQLGAKPDAAPGTWSGEYKSKDQKSGGVLHLMGMIKKDLESQIQEGEKDEEFAQQTYEQLMADAANTRQTDSQSLTDKKATKADVNSKLTADSNTRRTRNSELMETKQYISELHGQCDFLVENFAFRKEARSKEREALVNAKAVLSGANFS